MQQAAGQAGGPERVGRGAGGGVREREAEAGVVIALAGAVGEEAEGVGDAAEGVRGDGGWGRGLVRVEEEREGLVLLSDGGDVGEGRDAEDLVVVGGEGEEDSDGGDCGGDVAEIWG